MQGLMDLGGGVGWIGTLVIGGLAGWIAEKVMKTDQGIIMNIIVGPFHAPLSLRSRKSTRS